MITSVTVEPSRQSLRTWILKHGMFGAHSGATVLAWISMASNVHRIVFGRFTQDMSK